MLNYLGVSSQNETKGGNAGQPQPPQRTVSNQNLPVQRQFSNLPQSSRGRATDEKDLELQRTGLSSLKKEPCLAKVLL